jgi:hypothetical protein
LYDLLFKKLKIQKSMNNLFKILSVLIFIFNTALAQEGQKYPAMSGDDLHDKHTALPQNNGKVSLIAIAYSEESEAYLKDWRQPLFDLFVQAPGTDLFEFDAYDANLKFVVLLTGIKKAAEGKVRSKMEDNVQEHWKEHIVIIKGKTLDHYPTLHLGKTKGERVKPYFFLLDKSGKIVYATSGEYTTEKQQELEDKLQKMLGDNQFKD